MSKNERLKEILNKNIEIALSNKDTKQLKKRLQSLNKILKEDTEVNPKFSVMLEDELFFMRSYIEGDRAWFWICNDDEAGTGEDLFYEEVFLSSTDEEKFHFIAILDYLMERGEIA